MRHFEAKIRRDEYTTYSTRVPEWELQVLEMMFDPENVTRTGESTTVDREYPSGGYEFDRLTKAYGIDNSTGTSYVSQVFGNGGLGIRALERLMREERSDEGSVEHVLDAPAAPADGKKVRQAGPRKVKAASSADPLFD